jgi:hypothetical protein
VIILLNDLSKKWINLVVSRGSMPTTAGLKYKRDFWIFPRESLADVEKEVL